MPPKAPEDMVGRRAEWARLSDFVTSGETNASLGIVWGRRRIGKSFLLESLVELLLFGTAFTPAVVAAAASRRDVELIDLDRLYTGS